MAPSRLYRDYMEEDTYETSDAPRRSVSTKAYSDRATSPQTVFLDDQMNGEPHGLSDIDENSVGIAQTKDDFEDSTTPYESDVPEPVLVESQIDDQESLDGPTDLPAIPDDVRKQQITSVATSLSGSSNSARDNQASPAQSAGVPVGRISRQSRDEQRRPDINIRSPSSRDANTIQILPMNDRVSMGKMPEFFTRAIFQIVLHNHTIAHQLLEFARSRLCGENIEFLERVNRYHSLLNEVSKAIAEIHRDFVSPTSPTQINLTEEKLLGVNHQMKSALNSTLPSLESIFADAQVEIQSMVYGDIYPKFVRNQISISAAKALGGDRGKYAGLGDCFVLTDPAKADNPIVYASDGFVKVTGYTRNEIIPRNCRFLQNSHTDRAAVTRMRVALEKREEIVELILNEKKTGEPFWNLLYMAPLFDQHGRLIFFLGGQVNCSTTIHSQSDVLRILAQSKDTDENAAENAVRGGKTGTKSRRSILSAFRNPSRSNLNTPQRQPGMENELVDRLGNMPLKSQFRAFYTAYSHVSPSCFRVQFERMC